VATLCAGLAYLKLGLGGKAATEFRSILENKSRLFTSAFSYGAAYAYPAAQVGLARALAMERDVEASRQQYQQFFTLWKKADPTIPLLLQAENEYAALTQVTENPAKRPGSQTHVTHAASK
jgi:hypothetical protein